MSDNKNNRLNLYDYFGFPDRQQRDEAKEVFNMEKLRLTKITDSNLWLWEPYFEQYNVWSHHINNFSSHLGLHLLLMYYQYKHNPLDTINMGNFESPQGAYKLYFDTFAEDTSLYLISYFDKHLEMFNDLYHLGQGKKKRHLSRIDIIDEMQKIDSLQKLANQYRNIEQSQAFRQIKTIRDSFVHNKSSSYHGMNVKRASIKGLGFGYISFASEGIATQATYDAVCELIKRYERLCEAVNEFFNKRIEESKQD